MTRFNRTVWAGVAALVLLGLAASQCTPSQPASRRAAAGVQSDAAQAALRTYVAPGDLDEYYMFSSGGHSGQVYVYGVPSMRHLATIPVYTPYPATGYGFDDDTKKMLGELTWGDAHHPALSETKGEYDGRWLFINEMNGRIARIDLRDFKTKQILGPVPNLHGNHASSFVTPNTEYAMMATRFSRPVPNRPVGVDKYATEYKGIVAGVKIDPASGQMSLGWQILMPPFDYDLGDAGKLVSDGWMFFSSYNTERATGKLEVTASQRDQDYIAAVDWRAAEKAIADGKFETIDGVKVIDPKKVPGIVYLMPCGKSPHGVDVSPDGKWIIGSGKLQGVTTAFNFEKIQTAIRNKDFAGDEDGIPVLKYASIKDAEVAVGLGPLHTQFGPDGWAYTSLFVDSAIAKWKLGTWEVVDKAPMLVLHRASRGGRRRHGQPRRQLPGRPEQVVARPAPERRSVTTRVVAAARHLRGEDEAPLRCLHRAGAALRANHQGRQDSSDRGVPEGREQAPDGDLGREGRRRHPQRQKAAGEDGRRALHADADFVRGPGRRRSDRRASPTSSRRADELHGFGLLDYNINLVIDPGETKTVTFTGEERRRVRLLLHQLLLRAPPGDAGLHDCQVTRRVQSSRVESSQFEFKSFSSVES